MQLYIVILEVMEHDEPYNVIIRSEIADSPQSAIAQASDHYRFANDPDYEVEAHAMPLNVNEAKFIYQTNGG